MSNMLHDGLPTTFTMNLSDLTPTDGFFVNDVKPFQIQTKFVDAKVEFIKTHEKAVLPTKAHDNDTGFDVHATESVTLTPGQSKVVPIGLKLGYITPGYWILIGSRSGLGFKHNLTAHPGVIDEGYRGSLDILIRNLDQNRSYTFNVGDKVAQLIVFRNYTVEVSEATEAVATARGEKGFGSSGR